MSERTSRGVLTETKEFLEYIIERDAVVLNSDNKEAKQILTKLDALIEAEKDIINFQPCSSEVALHSGEACFFVNYTEYMDEYQIKSVDPEYFRAHRDRARLLHQATRKP